MAAVELEPIQNSNPVVAVAAVVVAVVVAAAEQT
jgi:hypothetical protein